MNTPFLGVKTLIFCDETKFNIANEDVEDAIYYFGISVEKENVARVNGEIKEILQRHSVKTEVFHSTKIFRETRPRPKLMDDLSNVIVRNRLKCSAINMQRQICLKQLKS